MKRKVIAIILIMILLLHVCSFVFAEEVTNEVKTDEQIYNVLFEKIKELNKKMPSYKAIKAIILTETPLIKTSTNKIKRQANLDAINEANH